MANAAVDLTTLANVKAFLRLTDAAMDSDATATLERLITDKSQQAAMIADRAFIAADYVETRDGNGQQWMRPYNCPILSVTSLTVDGVAIPARPSVTGDGYTITDGKRGLALSGSYFTKGTQNVVITYRAGYEAGSIPQDVEGAVINLVALAWKGMDRIGQTYKVMDGMVIDNRGSTEFADAMRTLKAYREVWL